MASITVRKSLICTLSALLPLFFMLSGCAAGESRFGNAAQTSYEDSGVSVIFLGDPQSGPDNPYDYSVWGNLLSSAASCAPDSKALILGGDIINDETDEDEWGAFFGAGGDILNTYSVYPVSGNHVSDKDIISDHFSIPESSFAGDDGLFYSVDIGDIHFIMLDSVVMGSLDGDVRSLVADWMEKDLSSCESEWIIAVMHHPMYALTDSYKDSLRAETMRENYLPILEKYGAAAILCGHQHAYARTLPLLCGTPSEGGIIEIMGISGGKQYAVPTSEIIAFSYSGGPVFTVITAGSAKLSFETYDGGGQLVDCETLTK